jgi:hypothetical protein
MTLGWVIVNHDIELDRQTMMPGTRLVLILI